MTLLRDKEAPAKFLPCLLRSTNMRVVAIELLWVLAAFQRLIKKCDHLATNVTLRVLEAEQPGEIFKEVTQQQSESWKQSNPVTKT